MAQPTASFGLSPFASSSPLPLFASLRSSIASMFGAPTPSSSASLGSSLFATDAPTPWAWSRLAGLCLCLEPGRASVDSIAAEGGEVVEDGGDGGGQEEGAMG
ncbi:hypothetical protein ACJRO7_007144 [Eucalyptus globulus]|uniref:Uncharacterized protein n=1 Tax=Eucalyptus globulus TaxID=34317 RepID=A0ABD3IK78_EUCGL